MNNIKFAKLISRISYYHSTSQAIDENDIIEIDKIVNEMVEESRQASNLVPLFDAILQYRKIDAIKAYRDITRMGLKESKDEIERLMSAFKPYSVE
jgi:ribosomal protein L7/L12